MDQLDEASQKLVKKIAAQGSIFDVPEVKAALSDLVACARRSPKKKSNGAGSSPAAAPFSKQRPDEDELDRCMHAVFVALRAWRKGTMRRENVLRLEAAWDAYQAQLRAVVDRDEELGGF